MNVKNKKVSVSDLKDCNIYNADKLAFVYYNPLFQSWQCNCDKINSFKEELDSYKKVSCCKCKEESLLV